MRALRVMGAYGDGSGIKSRVISNTGGMIRTLLT